ncbi:defender against death DAD protein [Suhomyces tanzawaensis NRRL Y-17324]|uniref:Dolichyl-diphosphooligosaccharide--protein glycosyltransferase subunit OST2 n=1 Tax=Suhomyces tanzawaensis NRRL Y-17324 TaxID=984487 RepID=A0A1E4SSC8_9ASCO|nr:defender against death DAD protein [Suhomyces tanzawaensis NRRL Y-17324]ODV82418.1 defender against death DAD protein [Suhomyces tanzawaensis NRRL Y-17324]
MAKKEVAIKKAQAQTGTSASGVSGVQSKKISNSFGELFAAISTTYNDYSTTLTPRLKLIDLFLVFLVALGVLQFVYVILVGNFPFNAFLGGFISCVGQFVLLVSLRLQIKTPERSFGDFIFASLILHFVVYHFIN